MAARKERPQGFSRGIPDLKHPVCRTHNQSIVLALDKCHISIKSEEFGKCVWTFAAFHFKFGSSLAVFGHLSGTARFSFDCSVGYFGPLHEYYPYID